MASSLSDLIAAYQPASLPQQEENESTAKRTKNETKVSKKKKSGEKRKGNDTTTMTTSTGDSKKSHRSSRKRRRQQEEEQQAKQSSYHQQPKEEEEEVEVDYDFDWLHDFDDDNRRVDSSQKTNHFYEKYKETIQALYPSPSEKEGQQSIPLQQLEHTHQETLNVIHNALHPKGLDKNLRKGGIDGTGYSNSLAGRYRPRRKRVRIKPGTGIFASRRLGDGDDPDLQYRMETQEEVEDRVRRRECLDKNRFIRMRWKRRAVTFQEEQDVGNAFANQAERYLADKLRQEKKTQRKEELKLKEQHGKEERQKEMEEAKERERLDELEEDDSVREQSQLLAQLSQSQTLSGNNKNADRITEEGPDNTDRDEMDYWQDGHVKPRSEDLQFQYNPSMKDVVDRTSAEISSDGEHQDDQGAEVKATFRQLTTTENTGEGDRFYFPPNSTLITNSTTTFRPGFKLNSARQFLIMASRALCGSPSDVTLENQYIRLLCIHSRGLNVKREEDATLSNFRMGRFLTMLAEEQGQSMYLYSRNSWSDSNEAARQLGLLDSHQECPISDNILTSIQGSYKAVRAKAKKSLQTSSIEWSYENIADEDIDSKRETGDDESMDKDVPTTGGIMDLRTQASVMAATQDGKALSKLSEESRGALITPNCLYSHVAGTLPPVPQSPMDPTNTLFGPVDKYANFYHTSVRMDHGVYKLILSTLLARLSKERCGEKSLSATKTQDQVSKLVAEYAAVNENNLHKRIANQFITSDIDIPLVEFYRGVFELCNFLVNGCARRGSFELKREEYDHGVATLDGVVGSRAGGGWLLDSGVKHAAESVWNFCRSKINHNGLLRFPKLRVTYAIAMICRFLPETAAEILSRPLDDEINRSPLHLFKKALEHMEGNKMFLDTGTLTDESARDSVLAAELEYVIHDASDVIQEAILLDPANVDYHLWHIGCLASCLLLSSGNKISSRAHLYPSQKKGSVFISKRPRHEVRTQLKKYDDVRHEVSTAVKSLLALVRHQGSAKAHLAISAVLEWTQLMGLLVGSSLDDYIEDITRLHTFHIQQWAQKDPSSFVWKYTRHVEDMQDAATNSRNLELSPHDISAWRSLVQCLGPIGSTKAPPKDFDIDKHREVCKACRRLCHPRWIDHHKISNDRSLGLWWGQGREWWEDSVLFLAPAASDLSAPMRRDLIASVLSRLRKEGFVEGTTATSHAVMDRISEREMNDETHEWLPRKEDIVIESHSEIDISEDDRTICYAAQLPKSFEAITTKTRTTASLQYNLPYLSSSSLEIKAYKILLLCHLFGPDHSHIEEHIYRDFVYGCYQNGWGKYMKDHCDELIVLKWFISMGINLEAIFEDICTQRGIRSATFRIAYVDDAATARTSSSATAKSQSQMRASSTAGGRQRRTGSRWPPSVNTGRNSADQEGEGFSMRESSSEQGSMSTSAVRIALSVGAQQPTSLTMNPDEEIVPPHGAPSNPKRRRLIQEKALMNNPPPKRRTTRQSISQRQYDDPALGLPEEKGLRQRQQIANMTWAEI